MMNLNLIFTAATLLCTATHPGLAVPPGVIIASSPACGGTLERLKYNNLGLMVDSAVGLWAFPLLMDFNGDNNPDLVVTCPDKAYNGVFTSRSNATGRRHRSSGFRLPWTCTRCLATLPAKVDHCFLPLSQDDAPPGEYNGVISCDQVPRSTKRHRDSNAV